MSEDWVKSFFNSLYWNLLMKRTPEEIKNEGDLIAKLSGLNSNKKEKTILDVCCGVADIGQHLTKYGTVSGIELSLDYKKESLLLAPDVKVYNKSVLDIELDEQYDVVYNWYSSFAYFSNETNKKLLKNCFKWTKKEGVFLLEIYNAYAVLKNFIPSHHYQIEYDNKMYNIERKSNIDWKERKLNQLWNISENSKLLNQYETYTIIYLVDELVKMIEEVGFQDIEVHGRNNKGQMEEYSIESPRLIIKALRRT